MKILPEQYTQYRHGIKISELELLSVEHLSEDDYIVISDMVNENGECKPETRKVRIGDLIKLIKGKL